jgi:hypothetical protein
MKNFIQINRNKLIYATLLGVFIIFTSCQQESIDDDFLILEKTTFIADGNCATDCLNPEGPYVTSSDFQELAWGGGRQDKSVSYTVYNTPTHFLVEVNYERNNGNASDLIRVVALGETQEAYNVQSGSLTEFMFALESGWETCDAIDFEIRQEGQGSPIDLAGNYSLFTFCGCTEDFNYVSNEDGSYTFIYLSEENLEQAQVKFTTPHITGFEALDGKEYTTNPGQGNGASNVLTWTGDITMCEEITFTLVFHADCFQNNAGFATVFSDFKVNDVSKKGETGNIKLICE